MRSLICLLLMSLCLAGCGGGSFVRRIPPAYKPAPLAAGPEERLESFESLKVIRMKGPHAQIGRSLYGPEAMKSLYVDAGAREALRYNRSANGAKFRAGLFGFGLPLAGAVLGMYVANAASPQAGYAVDYQDYERRMLQSAGSGFALGAVAGSLIYRANLKGMNERRRLAAEAYNRELARDLGFSVGPRQDGAALRWKGEF